MRSPRPSAGGADRRPLLRGRSGPGEEASANRSTNTAEGEPRVPAGLEQVQSPKGGRSRRASPHHKRERKEKRETKTNAYQRCGGGVDNQYTMQGEAAVERDSESEFLLTDLANQHVRKGSHISRTEVLSSLTLQVILYLNVVFLPFYFSAYFILLEAKYQFLKPSIRFLPIALGSVLLLVEPMRMFLAISGNLQEKIPLFAGFWLLTAFLELPIVIYLLSEARLLRLPSETILNVTLCTFLLFELGIGCRIVRRIIRVQASKFHLKDVSSELELVNPKPKAWVPLNLISYEL